jgi:hypothetical protein
MGLTYKDGKFVQDTSNNAFITLINNPNVRLIFFIVIAYIIIFSILNSYSTPDASPLKKSIIFVLEVIIWILFAVIFLMNFNDPSTLMKDILTFFGFYREKKVETPVVTKPVQKDEVYHIPLNSFTYKEAGEVCNAFKGRLATYQEVENAYNNGANWCSYGWSSDQMALFPIQNSVYNELKNIPGHEHDCGRPGVNGGYMKDNTLKFGINCYGKKPNKTELDKKYMDSYSFSPYYDEQKIELEKQKKIKDILVAPFNKQKWNIYE